MTNLTLIKITKNFQVTLPAKLRQVLKLKEGDYLEAKLEKQALVLRPKKLVDIDPDQAWFWTDEWQNKEKEVDKKVKQGRVKRFKSFNALAKELNS